MYFLNVLLSHSSHLFSTVHFILNVLLHDKYKRTAVGRSLLLQLSSLLSLEKDSYRLTVECCVNVTLPCAHTHTHTLCCPCLWIYNSLHHRAGACDDLWIIDWTHVIHFSVTALLLHKTGAWLLWCLSIWTLSCSGKPWWWLILHSWAYTYSIKSNEGTN